MKKFNEILKIILPFDPKYKLIEFRKLLERGDISLFKLRFLKPPVLYKKIGSDNVRSLNYMRKYGYELNVENRNIVVTDNGYFNLNGYEFNVDCLDSVNYYHNN